MVPGGFPILPALVFPNVALPALPASGLDVVDVTAALAVLVFAFAGLVALRIAVAMSREEKPSAQIVSPSTPSDSGERARKAA